MMNTIISKKGIENYGILDGFVSKKGIAKDKIKTKNGEMEKVTFTLVTKDISDKMIKFLSIAPEDIITLGGEDGKDKLMCVRVEALHYNAIFCKNLKPNSRVQLLGEFKTREYNGKRMFNFLLSTKPISVS